MSIRISLLTLAMALVVGLGFVSSAQAALYDEDFEGLTDGLLAGQDSWTGAGASVGVGTGGGINGTSGMFIAVGSSATPSVGRSGTIAPGNPLVQFRALVNVSLSSNAIVQMNLMANQTCCANGPRAELGIKSSKISFNAGEEFSVATTIGTNGWIEVQLEYNQGTGPSDQGTMVASARDVDDTTGAPLEAFQFIGSFVPKTPANKLFDLDWDAGMIAFAFGGDKPGITGGPSGNGGKVDNIRLENTPVTDAGLIHLKGLTKLENLDLSRTQVTDAGLEHLKGLNNLQQLFLGRTPVTDAGLIHLKGLTKLENLGLSRTQVTDAGLVHLKGLTNLKYMNLKNTQVTDEGVKKLQQALPNCTIRH